MATLDRGVSVSLKTILNADYANALVTLRLVTSVAIADGDVHPRQKYRFRVDENGDGTVRPAVPPTGAWDYEWGLPDGRLCITPIAAGPDTDLATLMAGGCGGSSDYNPADQIYLRLDADNAPMAAELPLVGDPVEDLGAAPKQYVDAVKEASEPSLGDPTVDGHVLSSTIAGVRSWIAQAVAAWGSITGDIANQTDLVTKFGEYLLKVGGAMTGGLSVVVPTATESALVLQTTDDDTANEVIAVTDSDGNVQFSSSYGHTRFAYGKGGDTPSDGMLIKRRLGSIAGRSEMVLTGTNSSYGTKGFWFQNHTVGSILDVHLFASSRITTPNMWVSEVDKNLVGDSIAMQIASGSAYIYTIRYASSPYPPTVFSSPQFIFRTKAAAWPDLAGYGTDRLVIDSLGNIIFGGGEIDTNVISTLKSDTINDRDAFRQETSWISSADGSRTAKTRFYISDYTGEHLAFEIHSTGSSVTEFIVNLPTTAVGRPANAFWNNSGVVNIA